MSTSSPLNHIPPSHGVEWSPHPHNARQRTAGLNQDITFTLGALVLCILVPGLLGDWQVTGSAGGDGSVALQLIITAWAGLRLARLLALGEPRPFAIVFWLYVYVWLGLAGLLQVIHQEAPHLIPISPTAYARGQFITLLGIAALEIGHLFSSRRNNQKPIDRHIVHSRVKVLVGFVLLTAPLWYLQLGGFHALFSSRQELASTIQEGKPGSQAANLAAGGIRIAFATVPSFLALYAVIVMRRYKLWRRRSHLVVALLAVVALILNSPVSMPRFWIATIAVALFFAIPMVQQRPAAIRLFIAAAIFICIALFPYAAYFRYSSGFKQPPGIVATLTTTADFDSFEMVNAGVQYTLENGLRYGNQALGDVFFFVPRSAWPSKAQDTGTLLAQYYHISNTNLSSPLWIEAYIDFGYAGVVAIFFLFGLVMRRADDRFVKADSPFAQFAIPLLAGYSCIILRGSLLQAMARLALMLVILWLISARSMQKVGSIPARRSVTEI